MTSPACLPVDWTKAEIKASRYVQGRTDWWSVSMIQGARRFTLIGEDTDGDGVVDFIHADTTGSGRMNFSAYFSDGKWVPTNLVEAWLEVSFALPWARREYVTHNSDIYFNGVSVAAFRGDLPEGHYVFPIPPRAIRFPGGPENENRIEIKSEHLRGGHYVVTSDFQVLYRLTEVDTYVIAESREAAEKSVFDTPGFRFKGMDLGVNSNDLSISRPGELKPGDKVEITANLQNLGMDPGKDVTVALMQTPMGSGNSIEVARVTVPEVPLYGPLPVKLPWTAVPGEQVLRVVIDPDKTLEENSRFNNEALLTVKVSGKDTPPQLEVTQPEDGKKFDAPKVRIEMRGIDESGISLLEYAIDGGLWTARKGADRISEEIAVQPGAHTLHFRATDCSGNQAACSRQITVECATPTLAILIPAEGAVLPRGSVAVTVGFDSPAGIKALEARAADGAWKAIEFSG
ncbi:MAG: CARDB domain-containing protein, partial [Desulfobacterales bacterium]|nr:CARDB domain-containing protein [Desulfobacterales bacterium]